MHVGAWWQERTRAFLPVTFQNQNAGFHMKDPKQFSLTSGLSQMQQQHISPLYAPPMASNPQESLLWQEQAKLHVQCHPGNCFSLPLDVTPKRYSCQLAGLSYISLLAGDISQPFLQSLENISTHTFCLKLLSIQLPHKEIQESIPCCTQKIRYFLFSFVCVSFVFLCVILSLSLGTEIPKVSGTTHEQDQKIEYVFLQLISEMDFPYNSLGVSLEHLGGGGVRAQPQRKGTQSRHVQGPQHTLLSSVSSAASTSADRGEEGVFHCHFTLYFFYSTLFYLFYFRSLPLSVSLASRVTQSGASYNVILNTRSNPGQSQNHRVIKVGKDL